MISISYTDTEVRLAYKHLTVKLKPLHGSSPAALEDTISQVFKVSAISHRVRDLAMLEYPKPTKVYVEREGSVLSIESECGETAEMSGSLLGLKALLEVAGVPCEG